MESVQCISMAYTEVGEN